MDARSWSGRLDGVPAPARREICTFIRGMRRFATRQFDEMGELVPRIHYLCPMDGLEPRVEIPGQADFYRYTLMLGPPAEETKERLEAGLYRGVLEFCDSRDRAHQTAHSRKIVSERGALIAIFAGEGWTRRSVPGGATPGTATPGSRSDDRETRLAAGWTEKLLLVVVVPGRGWQYEWRLVHDTGRTSRAERIGRRRDLSSGWYRWLLEPDPTAQGTRAQ